MRYAIVLMLLIAACASSPTGNATSDTIKIGVIGPYAGENAILGESQQKGTELALKNLGNTKYNYELIYEDDQLTDKRTVAAYQKLANVDNVAAVIGLSSGSGNAIAGLAENDGTLFCSVASDPAIVENRRYVFKHWVTPEAQLERYVEEVNDLDWERIVVLRSNQQATAVYVDELKKQANDLIIDDEIIDPAVKDVRTTLLKYKDSDFDAFLIALLPAHQEAILRQVKEIGFNKPLTSIETFEFMEGEALDLVEGEWYINAADPTGEFSQLHEQEYGTTPGFATPNAYDCVNILVKAFEEGDGKPEQAIEIIHNLQGYEGAMGNNLYYNDGSIESPAIKKEVRNRTFVSLE